MKKDMSKKKLLFVAIVFVLVVNLVPFFLGETYAADVSNIVTDVSLVKTNSTIESGYDVVSSGASYDQIASKYFIMIDFAKNNSKQIKDGDTFTVDVDGLLLRRKNENTTSDLILVDKNNNTSDTIGIIKVEDITASNVRSGKITVTFNKNVEKYTNIDGKIFVRNSVDYNKRLEDRNFTALFKAGSAVSKSISLNHVDISPSLSFGYKNNGDDSYDSHFINRWPSDNVLSRVLFAPANGYTIVDYAVDLNFNDYFLDFFKKYTWNSDNKVITYEDTDPTLNGTTVPSSKYSFTRDSSNPPRRPDLDPEDHYQEIIDINSKWHYVPKLNVDEDNYMDSSKNELRLNSEANLSFYVAVNHIYTENPFQAISVESSAAIDIKYGLDYYDEVSTSVTGDTTGTTVTPSITTSITSKPNVTSSVTSKPNVTSSVTSKPAVTSSVTSKPAVTSSVTSKPNITSSVTSKPAVTSSVTSKPNVTSSVTSKPNVTSSVTSKPAVTSSVTSKPNVTSSVTSKPAVTSSVTSKPAVIDTSKTPTPIYTTTVITTKTSSSERTQRTYPTINTAPITPSFVVTYGSPRPSTATTSSSSSPSTTFATTKTSSIPSTTKVVTPAPKTTDNGTIIDETTVPIGKPEISPIVPPSQPTTTGGKENPTTFDSSGSIVKTSSILLGACAIFVINRKFKLYK